MAETYRVQQDYAAVVDNKPVVLSKGQTVELDSPQAEWIERDAPGTLAKPKSKPDSGVKKSGGEG